MALADDFQQILDSLPSDWTDLELDLRIDENRYIEAAVLLVTANAQPYSNHDWHFHFLIAHHFGHATSAPTVHGTLKLLVQLSLEKHPDLPDVPLVMDFATTDEQKQILRLVFARQVMGRPFTAPPGLPADRLAALRQAFAATMADKEFLAEAEKAQVEITPVPGEAIQKLIADVYATPASVGARATALLR